MRRCVGSAFNGDQAAFGKVRQQFFRVFDGRCEIKCSVNHQHGGLTDHRLPELVVDHWRWCHVTSSCIKPVDITKPSMGWLRLQFPLPTTGNPQTVIDECQK